jgi:hypothetical protein
MGKVDSPKWQAILATLHPKQRRFVDDRRQGVAARCGRAWGKSWGVAAKYHRPSASHPRMSSVFVTQSATRSRDILLPSLMAMNDKFKLGLRYQGGDHNCVYWPNEYRVCFRGCKDRNEANKRRGTPWVMAHWDECDAIDGELLEYDIHECVEPRLIDVDGVWSASGTPGIVQNGYWHKLSSGQHEEFPIHEGDARDNPNIPGGATAYFLKALRRMGADKPQAREKWPPGVSSLEQILDDPKLWHLLPARFVREYLGLWVVDTDSRIYRLTPANNYQGLIFGVERTTIGLDLGGADDENTELDHCAITVAQSTGRSPRVLIPKSFSLTGVTLDGLERLLLDHLQEFPGASVHIDSASAGKIIENTFRKMGIPIQHAIKGPKLRRIQLIQSLIDSANLMLNLRETSDLRSEATMLVWNEKRIDHHKKCKDDCWDSLLYAVVPHLGLHEDDTELPPQPGTAEFEAMIDDQELEEAFREAQGAEDWAQAA